MRKKNKYDLTPLQIKQYMLNASIVSHKTWHFRGFGKKGFRKCFKAYCEQNQFFLSLMYCL